MRNRINFIGIPLDELTMSETLDRIDDAIVSRNQLHHCVINAGKVVKIQNDRILKESVINSNLINADGMSIVWAARFLGYNFRERVAGIDLMEHLVELAHKKNYSCYFLGAREGVVKKLVDDYSKKYSKNLIAGYRNGYFKEEDQDKIVDVINKSGANILFVAMTSPKKEIFLNKYKNELINVNFIMGVGGSFDVISGSIKRAPKLIQEIGLEWCYRFLQEPRRMWRRYLVGNLRFIFLILKNKFFST